MTSRGPGFGPEDNRCRRHCSSREPIADDVPLTRRAQSGSPKRPLPPALTVDVYASESCRTYDYGTTRTPCQTQPEFGGAPRHRVRSRIDVVGLIAVEGNRVLSSVHVKAHYSCMPIDACHLDDVERPYPCRLGRSWRRHGCQLSRFGVAMLSLNDAAHGWTIVPTTVAPDPACSRLIKRSR